MLREMNKILQFEITSEKLNDISKKDLNEIYDELHKDYVDAYQSLGSKPDNVDDYFSWLSYDLDIHLVYYKENEEVKTIFFLSKAINNGEILIHDLIKESISYEILKLQTRDFVSELITAEMLKINPEDILDLSFFMAGHVVSQIGEVFFEREYKGNFMPQLKPVFKSLEFNNLKIHKNIYNFNEIITMIDNKQFIMEFKECMDAYQEEKFFVAAAGLGSVLEHLLFLAIEKHVPEDEIKTNENSTASEYIGQLKKPPFNLSKRDVTNLKGTFAFRNSVSHFNKGYFSKDMCDQLLNGIKICFDRYYMLQK